MDANQRRAADSLVIYPACRLSALKDAKNGENRKLRKLPKHMLCGHVNDNTPVA